MRARSSSASGTTTGRSTSARTRRVGSRRPSSTPPASPGTSAATSSSATSASSTACSTRRWATTSTSTSAPRTSTSSGRWVPYPFQNNLRYLPNRRLRHECLARAVRGARQRTARRTSRPGWSAPSATGITRHFMRPYNARSGRTPPESMSADLDRRARERRRLRAARCATSCWTRTTSAGARTTRSASRATGGTGEIYRRLAARLAPRVRYGTRARRRSTCAGASSRFADGTVGGLRRPRLHDAARPPRRRARRRAPTTSARRRERSSTTASRRRRRLRAPARGRRARGSTSRTPTCPSTG